MGRPGPFPAPPMARGRPHASPIPLPSPRRPAVNFLPRDLATLHQNWPQAQFWPCPRPWRSRKGAVRANPGTANCARTSARVLQSPPDAAPSGGQVSTARIGSAPLKRASGAIPPTRDHGSAKIGPSSAVPGPTDGAQTFSRILQPKAGTSYSNPSNNESSLDNDVEEKSVKKKEEEEQEEGQREGRGGA